MNEKMKALPDATVKTLTRLERDYEAWVSLTASTYKGTPEEFAELMQKRAQIFRRRAEQVTGEPMLLAIASVRGEPWCAFYFPGDPMPQPTNYSHLLDRTKVQHEK